ncbi:MAG: GNAT family N-acetyltransferase [Leptolyngbya sp. PLA1]|nr:GNAT family N-acetyltransferase [Leptolyngbya sp. PLA1]
MATITVRPATPRDIDSILGFIRELAEYERAPQEVVATPESLREHLFGPRPACEAIIGEVDGIPRGFALYFHNFSTWKGRPGLYLEDLYVQPACRGAGLGKALFRRVAAVAAERGCPRMEWAVLDWNTPAIDFYRALGAVAMDEWTVYRLTGDALARAGG